MIKVNERAGFLGLLALFFCFIFSCRGQCQTHAALDPLASSNLHARPALILPKDRCVGVLTHKMEKDTIGGEERNARS